MLTIRLQRTGKKNAASFRIVVAEKAAPVSKKFNLKNPDRIQYWISQRIEISPTVHNLLVTKGILKADKVQAFKIKKKPEAEKSADAQAAAPAAQAPTAETPAADTATPETPATQPAPGETAVGGEAAQAPAQS
jgi:ribosomal protein S16